VKYHLDTCTVIDVLRFHRESLLNYELTPIQDIAISSIVAHELLQAAQPTGSGSRSKKVLVAFLASIEVLPFRLADADVSANISANLQGKSQLIGKLDPFIAAHAISEGAVLVTRNVKHFNRVPDLHVVDWSKHEG
jgi:tRNA(fMet)-specific endonuclease VapC